MENITLSWYIETIRKHSRNHRECYQKILNDLFGIIFHDDDEEHHYVESTSSSRIMTREFDVPKKVRKEYNEESDENKKKISDAFIKQMIDSSSMDRLIHEVKGKISLSKISEQSKKMILEENDPFMVLSYVLSIVIISSNKIVLRRNLHKDSNGSIDLISGDLIALGFNKKLATSERIIVVPVDDKFTMTFQNEEGEEIISKDTIHGKWLLRMNKLGIEKPKIKYIKTPAGLRIGKYKVGKTEFYLVPVSSLKERNKAESGREMITDALNALASEYNISGQGIPIYVPLIGTGRSRAHLSLNESVSLIRDIFLGYKDGFFGEVKIVVHPKDVNESEE